MPVEFYEEDNLSAIAPRAYALITRPRSKMVRALMKAGFKTKRGAEIFLVVVSLGIIAYVGLALYRSSLPETGHVTPLEDIPLNVRETMTPEELNYFRTQGGQ